MDKIKKGINIVATVILVFAVALCLSIIVQTIRGEQPHFFDYQFYRVMTGSMEPSIQVDANVVVKAVDTDTLQVGDVITFISRDPQIEGSANTHRIVEITQDESGQTCYITKGDANLNVDELAVYPEEVCGKVIYYTTAIYWISVFFDFVHTGTGFFTVIILPLLFVGYLFTKDFVRSVNKLLEESVLDEINNSEEVDHEADHEAERDNTTE